MKIRGVNNMPDSIQIRDGNFTLVSYFRADKPQNSSLGPLRNKTPEEIHHLVSGLLYGRLTKISTR